MSDWAIKVTDLGKRYRIGERQPYFRLTETLERALTSPLRRLRWGGSPRKHARETQERPADATHRLDVEGDTAETFWALRHASFEVPRGEVLGVIGRNGAGKSTLLKLIARITEPTEGEIRMRGRVASLLEVGTGFHPELTGRENVYLNGTILGMSHREVKAKFDEIVAFSGVETFLDTPVKRYSSGMRVRLAFAVAAHLEPEILVIDEVLAVGDAAFQSRCLAKMEDVAHSGRTILFVSHNISHVLNLCHSAVLLDRGGVVCRSEVADVVSSYTSSLTDQDPARALRDARRSGSGALRFVEIRAATPDGGPPRAGMPLWFRVRVEAGGRSALGQVAFAVTVRNAAGDPLWTLATRFTRGYFERLTPPAWVTCEVDACPLTAGHYRLSLWSSVQGVTADSVDHAGSLDVMPWVTPEFRALPQPMKHGPVVAQQRWRLDDGGPASSPPEPPSARHAWGATR